MGLFEVHCLNGSLYTLTFIDDYYRFTWIYFLKNKFLIFKTFKNFKILFEKETSLSIKTLRSDNGGEYIVIILIPFVLKMVFLDHSLPLFTPTKWGS